LAGVFYNLTLCMTKLRILVLYFSYFTDNSNMIWEKEMVAKVINKTVGLY
jgi:hypothetical protein